MKQKILGHSAVRYILAGALAYIVELSCILLLHKGLSLSAESSTALAFWVGLPTAFLLQKLLAFKDYQKTIKTISRQLVAYGVLVAINYAFTLLVVALFPDKFVLLSRTLALILTTAWNYIVYQYIFDAKKRPTRSEVREWLHNAIRLKNARVNVALLALPLIIFVMPLILTGNKIAPGDPDYYFQQYEAFRRSLLEFGQFPGWNPWIDGGIPLFANIQFGLVSLQAPFVLLFGTVIGMKIAVAAYLIVGYYGFRKLFKDSFSTTELRATLMAYIPMFSTFFVTRTLAGHFTFLLIAFFPWLLYFFLKRYKRWSWLWFALVYSFMVWSAPHYTTIMSMVVIGVWFAYELVGRIYHAWRLRNWTKLWQDLQKDFFFWLKAGAAIAVLTAYRMFFVYSFIKDFPRLEHASAEPFTGIDKGLWAIWRPMQYNLDAHLPSGFSWTEATTYIGFGTLICILLIIGAWLWQKYHGREKLFAYSPILLIVLFITFFILGMADFGPYSPFHLLNQLPVFDSMRVATRWLMWASLTALFFIAAYKGTRFNRAINILLIITVCELFITGFHAFYNSFTVTAQQYRSPQAAFEQERLYRIPRPEYSNNTQFQALYFYDENLYETTRNNLGQVIAGDSLVDTRQPNTTVRCGENQGGCQFLSSNAHVTYWSPNKIILERLGPGSISLNMNPGRGWTANGAYIFPNEKIANPKDAFVVTDPSSTIVLRYSPTLSPSWLRHKLGL